MDEANDTSLEGATRRNLRSDLRLSWGCQLGFVIYALALFVPLGLLIPFTSSMSVLYLAFSVFSMTLAGAANNYRKELPESTLRREISAWVLVIAPAFALVFLLLGLSFIFSF